MKNSSDPLVRLERRNDQYAQGWKEAVGEKGEYPWKKSGRRRKGEGNGNGRYNPIKM